MKTAIILGLAGLAMLLASFIPWSSLSATPVPAAEEDMVRSVASDIEYGRQLFAAKGCIGCHQHSKSNAAPDFFVTGPPNLTNYEADPAFLREWLHDPQAVRPGTDMPNLDLSNDEIEGLIAFLSQG